LKDRYQETAKRVIFVHDYNIAPVLVHARSPDSPPVLPFS
jgi:hypothetical protein